MQDAVEWMRGKIDKQPFNFPQVSKVVPVLSGGASVFLLNKLIGRNLTDLHLIAFLVTLVIIFIASVILFGYLKKIEKDKDQYLLSTVGKIVEDIFKHYGVAMASNAAGPTTATEMNPIMQTIVDLVEKLKELAKKGYLET